MTQNGAFLAKEWRSNQEWRSIDADTVYQFLTRHNQLIHVEFLSLTKISLTTPKKDRKSLFSYRKNIQM